MSDSATVSLEWGAYHDQNNTAGDCQLVTALNAYYYFTGRKVFPDSDEYEELVDLVGCRHGSAVCIKKAHELLGLEIVQSWTKNEAEAILVGRGELSLPSELNIWHHNYGFHSVALLDYVGQCNALRVSNFRSETLHGWIFGRQLSYFVRSPSSGHDDCALRSFKHSGKSDMGIDYGQWWDSEMEKSRIIQKGMNDE